MTIPKKVREALGLGPGDEAELEFVVEGDRATIYPRRRYRAADLPRLLRGSRAPFAGREAEARARALAEKESRVGAGGPT